ncbi:unnamed protein product [Rhizophagus irregularis]|uniref:Uncharacterized protein n=1 Tax=Rhizophagus irregularis TaxID=588596 RepID=A0A915YWX9_9GLOM|nr:unnamed protein product [Rhizophagus irregularis]CAB5108075.1 unnamed protein product [Rhizophagus irregularis]CAB5349889.1 unnamed protein product [Rhizophagus irregularis]
MKRKDIKLTIENIYAVAEGEETATHVDFKERFGENEEHSEGEFTDETYRSESSEEDENSEEDSILSEISFKLISNENENVKIYTREMDNITNTTDATTDTARSSRKKRERSSTISKEMSF